jgi:type II secretory pathway pseudopilin PulG
MKSKVAVLITLVIIAIILAAGCASSTQPSSNQSTSQSAEKVIRAVIDDDIQTYVNASWTRQVRNSTPQWLNDTTAMVTFTILTYTNETFQYTAKYQKFASAQDASNYVTSISQGYNATSVQALAGNDPTLVTAGSVNAHKSYEKVTNSTPVTNSWVKLLNDAQNAYRQSYIIQVNEVVITFSATFNRARA